MRIDLHLPSVERAGTERSAPSGSSASSPERGSGAGVDEARFSLDQTRIQALESKALGAPEVRQEKVDALRTALQEGRYLVTPDQTAESLMSELLARSSLLR